MANTSDGVEAPLVIIPMLHKKLAKKLKTVVRHQATAHQNTFFPPPSYEKSGLKSQA